MNDQKYTDAYSLLDLKPVMILQKNIKATLSTGVNNLTNSRYAASILPNAIGFGTAQPRSYPGNPRNYGGLAVSYLLEFVYDLFYFFDEQLRIQLPF
jgi:iron complex outermembrane receptor protein